MVEKFEAKEKKILSIDEKLADLNKEVSLFTDKDKNKQESKEKEITPELEKTNYKIDFGLSEEEKKTLKLGETKNGVTKEEDTAYFRNPAYGKSAILTSATSEHIMDPWIEKKIVVLKKKINGSQKNAFAREYLDGVPQELKGEQLFNRYALNNLASQGKINLKKLPTLEQMRAIKGAKKEDSETDWQTKHNKFLDNYFRKDGKDVFTGYYDSIRKHFGNLEAEANCWLSGGKFCTELEREGNFIRNDANPAFGLSVRLLK